MTDLLNEEQMRKALFGDSAGVAASPEKPSSANRSRPPRIRVTLHVSKIFEGNTEVFIHETSTLSTLLAEQEAAAAARKKKFKYLEVVSSVQV